MAGTVQGRRRYVVLAIASRLWREAMRGLRGVGGQCCSPLVSVSKYLFRPNPAGAPFGGPVRAQKQSGGAGGMSGVHRPLGAAGDFFNIISPRKPSWLALPI